MADNFNEHQGYKEIMMGRREKFYIAGSFRKLNTIKRISDVLEDCGCQQTYDWSENPVKSDLKILQTIANKEYQGINDCDLFVFVFPGGKGANVEFGIATALGKPIYIFDTTDQVKNPEKTSTFDAFKDSSI